MARGMGSLSFARAPMAAEGGRRDPERRGNWSWGTDRDGLGVDIPVLASARRRPGSQEAAWRRAATRRPPPAPTGEEEDGSATGPD